MEWRPKVPRLWARLLVPVLLLGAAVVMRVEFLPSLGSRNPFVTFYPAVMLAALSGGFLSGIVATCGSAVLALYWVQQGAFDPDGIAVLFVFAMACLVFSGLCEEIHRTWARLRLANEKLTEDVAERRRAEEALRTSEERFRRVFEDAPIGVAMTGSDFRFLRTNQAFQAFTGYTGTELSSMTFLDITHPDHAGEDREGVAAIVSGELAVYSTEKRYVRKDGTAVWAAVRVSAMRDSAGRLVDLVAVVEDIDHRKRAEEEARRLNAELEERIASRTTDLQEAVHEMEAFSYSVAHDLRAPIRAIDGFAAILDRDQGRMLDDEGRRRLANVRTNSARMGALIDDLLQFSRTSRTEMSWFPLDLTKLANEVVVEALLTARATRPRVTVAPLPAASGDAALLRVAVRNLVSNALKFSRRRDPPIVEIGSRAGPEGTEYFVRDNGVGFDPKYSGKLFGVFQKLHPVDEYTGTGIGLAVVRRIIERHGGRVWAESEVDRGATFWFTLGRSLKNGSGPLRRVKPVP